MGNKKTYPDIYSFTDYRSFLNAYFQAQKKKSSSFSTRRWCQDLKFKSPATLNMILRGKRNPSQNIAERMADYFHLDRTQREYFETLIKLAKAKNRSAETAKYLAKLSLLHPNKNFRPLEYDLFSAISNWHFFAIRELIIQDGFQEDPEWISKKLRGKISPYKAKEALDVLIKTQLVERTSSGKLIQKDAQIGR